MHVKPESERNEDTQIHSDMDNLSGGAEASQESLN